MNEYPNGSSALIDVAADPMGLEFGAALYESYAADWEAVCSPGWSADAYASTAHRLCEEIEYAWYESQSA